jgi:radical SAM superfamily enzyme YgiQ (UPF0313 family)
MRVVFADINPVILDSDGGASLPHLRDAHGGGIGTSAIYREPYGAELVAGAARTWAGVSVDLLIQGSDDADTYASRIADHHPDVVALGIHSTCVAHEASRVVRSLRSQLPRAIFAAGGYHPTGDPQGVLKSGVDAVIVGEAEASFAEMCASIAEGRPWDDIRGIVSRRTSHELRDSRFATVPFHEYPAPIRCGQAIRMSRCAPLAYPPPSEQTGAAQISYSRGCPYACPFCQSEQVFGHRVRYRRPADVVLEMRELRDKYGANFFFFTDLTFNLVHPVVFS